MVAYIIYRLYGPFNRPYELYNRNRSMSIYRNGYDDHNMIFIRSICRSQSAVSTSNLVLTRSRRYNHHLANFIFSIIFVGAYFGSCLFHVVHCKSKILIYSVNSTLNEYIKFSRLSFILTHYSSFFKKKNFFTKLFKQFFR